MRQPNYIIITSEILITAVSGITTATTTVASVALRKAKAKSYRSVNVPHLDM